MKPFLIAFSFLTVMCIHTYAGSCEPNEIPRGIVQALKTGNVEELAKYFNETIEINIFDKESLYNRTQAKQVMKDFFAKYAPVDFQVIHEGGKEESKYVIGALQSKNGKFRLTLLLKNDKGSPVIYQLRIDKENNE